MANHWTRRYQFLTQCSPGHPFVRKLGGGEVKFTDPEKLVDFLKNSENADRMWSDSEDLTVISDMYQLEIKVITTKGENDKNPTVNRIFPCEELKEYADLKNVELNEMVLLHEDDLHFNLIISKDSDLAKMGSLSNMGAFRDDNEEVDTRKDVSQEMEVKETLEKKDLKEDIEKMRIEIKQLRESKIVLEEEYSKCEQLLKKKTEEAAKLSIEVQDLKEIVSLEGGTKKEYEFTKNRSVND